MSRHLLLYVALHVPLLLLSRTCPLPQQEGGLKGSLRLAQGLHSASLTSGYSMMLTAAAAAAADVKDMTEHAFLLY
jgi:hypothetical protein